MAVRALGGLPWALGRAAVEADELVAHAAAAGDAEDAVAEAVDAEVGDGRVAAAAAGEDATGEDGDGAEEVGLGAGEGVGLGVLVRYGEVSWGDLDVPWHHRS